MLFHIYLHDLNRERSEALSDGESILIGTVEADSEGQAAGILGLEMDHREEDDCARYVHGSTPDDVEFEIDLPYLGPDLAEEDELIHRVQEVMTNRKEMCGLSNQ